MKQKVVLLIFVVLGVFAIFGVQHYSAAERGGRKFAELGCSGCHFSGGGPNLTNVVRKHDDVLLERFILDPQSVYRERNMKPLNPGYMFMPRVTASPKDVRDMIAYFHTLNGQDD